MVTIIEGFFGPAWPQAHRLQNAPFCKMHGIKGYIYAPKSDASLRKNWKASFTENESKSLGELSQTYRQNQVDFGVGLSPFELHNEWTEENKVLLADKIKSINDIGIDTLGLFFDDMMSAPGIAKKQLEMVNFVQDHTSAKIVFCPTYYSYDGILDKVFGKRPDDYLEEIAMLPSHIDVFWTGPKVLSDQIDSQHLEEVSEKLNRKPIIWDNVFANDGPKNCKFLKFNNIEERDRNAVELTHGWYLNPMNQGALSQIVSLYFINHYQNVDSPFEAALKNCCSQSLANWILEEREALTKTGLDQFDEAYIQKALSFLNELREPVAIEIASWLRGEFNVGSECLTD